ncbi:MAG TPA: hypothetical protein VJN72_10530 [Gaiellales bacterium]|nr:hypothetical protein [Gaiellales bacterium]
MSQSALPVATRPRTITVRVRTLLIAAAVVLAAALVWWALGYATGMQPLSTGSSLTGPHGLRVAAQTPSALGPGPTAYVWHPGGSYVVTVQIHNSASVPVTITGVGHTPGDWAGAISGPTIENGDGGTLEPIKGSFHQVRIGPDAYGVITLVFHANPKAVCGGGTAAWMDSVDLHFTTLGVFHNTQAVPLGELEAVMAAPRSGC